MSINFICNKRIGEAPMRFTKGFIEKSLKHIIVISAFTIMMIISKAVMAQCVATNKSCVMDEIFQISQEINNPAWRDKALRELAKSYTYEGDEAKALNLIHQVEKPDTKAMTIRGIGFAAADSKWKNDKRYQALFKNLTIEANKIKHEPSYAIAHTYIAMAQAFAKDDKGAMITAKAIRNEALRNKAFGETAEIQAERGDFNKAMASIAAINSTSFRNKAYGTIAGIFIKEKRIGEAYAAAHKIDNAYSKAQVLQKIVNFDNNEETLKK